AVVRLDGDEDATCSEKYDQRHSWEPARDRRRREQDHAASDSYPAGNVRLRLIEDAGHAGHECRADQHQQTEHDSQYRGKDHEGCFISESHQLFVSVRRLPERDRSLGPAIDQVRCGDLVRMMPVESELLIGNYRLIGGEYSRRPGVGLPRGTPMNMSLVASPRKGLS